MREPLPPTPIYPSGGMLGQALTETRKDEKSVAGGQWPVAGQTFSAATIPTAHIFYW
jgi:hypothetical protein